MTSADLDVEKCHNNVNFLSRFWIRFTRKMAANPRLTPSPKKVRNINLHPSIPTVPVEGGGQWFVISSCDIGNGKGNKSASSTCLTSVDRMAEMLLKAKLTGVPVHVTRNLCAVTETALKPL